jgi:hypothetical protein
MPKNQIATCDKVARTFKFVRAYPPGEEQRFAARQLWLDGASDGALMQRVRMWIPPDFTPLKLAHAVAMGLARPPWIPAEFMDNLAALVREFAATMRAAHRRSEPRPELPPLLYPRASYLIGALNPQCELGVLYRHTDLIRNTWGELAAASDDLHRTLVDIDRCAMADDDRATAGDLEAIADELLGSVSETRGPCGRQRPSSRDRLAMYAVGMLVAAGKTTKEEHVGMLYWFSRRTVEAGRDCLKSYGYVNGDRMIELTPTGSDNLVTLPDAIVDQIMAGADGRESEECSRNEVRATLESGLQIIKNEKLTP